MPLIKCFPCKRDVAAVDSLAKEGSALELMVFACLTGPKSSLIESFVLLLQSLLALPEMEQLDVCDSTIRVLTSTLPVDTAMHGRTLYSCSA